MKEFYVQFIFFSGAAALAFLVVASVTGNLTSDPKVGHSYTFKGDPFKPKLTNTVLAVEDGYVLYVDSYGNQESTTKRLFYISTPIEIPLAEKPSIRNAKPSNRNAK